jgi:hypothetical protein
MRVIFKFKPPAVNLYAAGDVFCVPHWNTGKERGKMSLTNYDYEAEMSDFAEDLDNAIKQAQKQYSYLSCDHLRYDDGCAAIVHERRGKGTDCEMIAYGYYLSFITQHHPIRFWIGKILYPPTQPLRMEIGIWADGVHSQIIPHTFSFQGGSSKRSIQAIKRPQSKEHFWPLPGSVPPYDDPLPFNEQTWADFLNAFLSAVNPIY